VQSICVFVCVFRMDVCVNAYECVCVWWSVCVLNKYHNREINKTAAAAD